MASKKERVQSIIGKNLSDIIIFKMKNDLTTLASINEVDINQDYSIAKVYVTHLQQDKIDNLIKFLNIHKGEIRAMLAKSIDIYKVPELVFIKDDLFDKGQKIDNIINSWKKD